MKHTAKKLRELADFLETGEKEIPKEIRIILEMYIKEWVWIDYVK